MTADAATRGPGRPRDATIDAKVLDAARDVLVAHGFNGATVQAIAARSGVHASAIYRRWPSRIEIIEQAVFPGLEPVKVRPTGDLRRDVRRFIRAFLAVVGEPAARAAIPGLLATYQSGRLPADEEWLAVSARPLFLDILAAAPAGRVDPAVDPGDVFDVLVGAMLARILVPTVVQRDRPIERLVDLTLRLLQPATAPSRR
jgi:AcrR family transcriptional regulator